ncbi:CRISPR-associated protein Cas7 [Hymenobacter cavernae]|uniref:CRISPR-associated protein Cas7 n=1 Tax=Hymenobacter cavernae TaxID=2044852 RepID=A0ABQ1UQD8_9BACT|nr:CRISPR-associated protein Cas7 [Hymenobacter cavernae]GGF22891.1 hypothetical protein GCM10011383_38220 [Hymenobacter cavernae]
MNPYIYLRSLRHAEHTVFGVQNGQKFYTDVQFNRKQAYSSGQQVKRSIMDMLTSSLNVMPAPITFNWVIKKEGKTLDASQREAWAPCDPSYVDQLLGGYMKAEKDNSVIKRRSPLSISAMRPLHPLLGGLEQEGELSTFDRTSHPNHHPVRVSDEKGNLLSEEQLQEFLDTTGRNLSNRLLVKEASRASGLFVYDVCVDLRTLFCVSTNKLEPELSTEIKDKLLAEGWIETSNVFGPCLLAPKAERERYIPALAHTLINWRITSNQSRTFSLMETLALAISDNANHLAGAIRARLDEEIERKAHPYLDYDAGAKLFVTYPAEGYIRGAINPTADALQRAEQDIAQRLRDFDYENQVAG